MSAPAPLAGIRVLDLGWYIAGPVCTKHLADHGAEVIKLESARSMDPTRATGPWLRGVNTAPDGSGLFTQLNRNKRSATLNLKHPTGREIFLQLMAVSDVVVDNYTAGAMDRLGLGYDVLSAVNPRIIMAELSGMGQTGEYRDYRAYGHTLMALSGGYALTGYADGPPQMPGYTLPDYAAAAMAAFAIVAALRQRERSGRGQYIDLGQYEIAASLFAEYQAEVLAEGVESTRQGNAEAGTLVHGVFACSGDDAWCAIVVRTAGEWVSLCELLGWEPSPPPADAADRAAAEARIEDWTRGVSAAFVMDVLQARGIDAARVQSSRDLMDDDPQLQARGFFREVDHLLGDRVPIDGIPYHLSLTPGIVESAGPVYGADNDYVLGDLVGLTPDAIRRLASEGVLG